MAERTGEFENSYIDPGKNPLACRLKDIDYRFFVTALVPSIGFTLQSLIGRIVANGNQSQEAFWNEWLLATTGATLIIYGLGRTKLLYSDNLPPNTE